MTRALIVALAACSSPRAKAVEDGVHAPPPPHVEAHAGDAAPAAAFGDVQIRVEWHDVPAAVRSSPGRTTCGTARAPAVAPTTTWGIPDVFVVLAADRASAAEPDARLALEGCALAPRAIVAGDGLAVRSSIDAPAQLSLARRGSLHELGTLAAGNPAGVLLPIAGHEVTLPLEPGGIYELALSPDTSAWIVAASHTYAAVTDGAGQAMLHDVPVGKYAVTAWLPPRAGQPGRVAHGEATIAAGALAELTVDLATR